MSPPSINPPWPAPAENPDALLELAKSLEVLDRAAAEQVVVLIRDVRRIADAFAAAAAPFNESAKQLAEAFATDVGTFKKVDTELRRKLGKWVLTDKENNKLSGVTGKREWKVRYVDLPLIPAEFWVLDTKELEKRAKEMKGGFNVPGVEAYEEPTSGLSVEE